MTRTRKNRQRRGGAGQAHPEWTNNGSDYGIKDDQYAGVWVQKN